MLETMYICFNANRTKFLANFHIELMENGR